MAKVSKSASRGVKNQMSGSQRTKQVSLFIKLGIVGTAAGAIVGTLIGRIHPTVAPLLSQAQTLQNELPSESAGSPPSLTPSPFATVSPSTLVEPSPNLNCPTAKTQEAQTASADQAQVDQAQVDQVQIDQTQRTQAQIAQAPAQSGFTQLVSDISQKATWVEQPAMSLSSVFGHVAPQVLPYLNPTPFPDINPLARQAKVPVMMYHDILPEKQVFFDVTPEEFEQHLKLIKEKGLTPISMDQLVIHLRTGAPLPPKPILLTFDDGYLGHYTHVYPLLKKYNYPGLFAIYTAKVGKQLGRSSLNWDQLRQMSKDPLITISSHSVNHKPMAGMPADELVLETQVAKRILETELKVPIRYFTYPIGKYDQAAVDGVQAAGYEAALTMRDADEKLAGESENLLKIERVGQSRLAEMTDVADAGPAIAPVGFNFGFDFASPLRQINATINQIPFVFIAGGKPVTIHYHTRGQVEAIIANTPAIAAVDGTFFSLEQLDSNELLGPVYSQSTGQFVPGKSGQIPFLEDRPLVLIGPASVRFVPFKSQKHNTLEALQTQMPDVTDAFVAAGWLVDNGRPQPLERFGKLYSVNEQRHRAFWGINQQGQPQIGVSSEPIGAVDLGIALAKAGFRDAVMLDSGASTSLAFKGKSLVAYEPRPVPHVVGLVPAPSDPASVVCPPTASQPASNGSSVR
jgi:poly-beta-1,6-N-acetyl-D-glucosamine N-deacetylase